MHIFICKSVRGKIVPEQSNKVAFMQKLLNRYEELDKKFKVTFELIEKNINEQQINLYNAFIVKASNHFGTHFSEMEKILFHLFPIEDNVKQPISKWTTRELDTFINQASALLAEQGFKFE